MTSSLTIHHTPEPDADIRVPDPHQDTYSKNLLGFWIYLMTDTILFATLFITYAVLHPNTFGGPSPKELFSLSITFAQTMVLLVSSFTCGFALLAASRSRINHLYAWLVVTILFGATFLFLELSEFNSFVQEGHSWRESAFLSAFFTLVGTHGLHITVGLLWATIMIAQLYFHGMTVDTFRRLVIFSLFWHFLDLVWIFVFTIVYLIGVI
ncbi:MAG: Cytochrome bo(3) ubiquinol oxidase subunit 3 [Chlamydiae bacterium]|nr:Cytochrome bo(3) ubiquinol oxidase subunit 3 [Chlamydiota bacterium]